MAKTIYRYDGNIESLKDKSRRPNYYPNQHTDDEIKMIKDYKRNNKETGLVVLWVKLREAGYRRTVQGLYHVMQRLGIYEKASSKAKTRKYRSNSSNISVRKNTNRCKICTNSVFNERDSKKRGKILSI